MQPYFFPYLGYFQLIAHVDSFVVYDNIKYTKKGWVNRNRLLLNGAPETFSLPLKAGSDALQIAQREVSDTFSADDLINKMDGAYRKAPFHAETMPLIEAVANFPGRNLFAFLRNSIEHTMAHLGISTPLLISSHLTMNHRLKGQDRVLAICKALRADAYVNPVGGMELYGSEEFAEHGVVLTFLKSRLTPYPQHGGTFVSALSILDVLFFTGRDRARELVVSDFDILQTAA